MYSLDYLLKRFYHKCTAWIIYSTDFITNAQLGLSNPHILSHVYSLDYRPPQIVSHMDSLDYRLHKFHHTCTAWIIYSTDVITNVQLIVSTPQILSHVYSLNYRLHRLYHTCTVCIIYSTDFITNVQLRLSITQI